MDYRFPKWLRTVVRKLEFLAIPNLGPLLVGVAVLGFFAQIASPVAMERLLFDPYAIIEGGEWWRLFTFPFLAGSMSPLWFLFYCLYIYYVMNLLEANWGSAALTVYLLFSYLSAMAGALVLRAPVNLSVYMMENISLAVGTLLPDLEFYIYMILPVKAKWLALFSGALILVSLLRSPTWEGKAFIGIAFLPYLVFFGPLLFNIGKDKWRSRNHRKRFDQNMWR